MAKRQDVDMSANDDVVKIVAATDAPADEAGTDETAAKKVKKTGPARSKKYSAVRANVDRTKFYDAFAAVELVKRLSYSKFEGTVTADLFVKEGTTQVELTLPHSTGKVLRVAIASDDLIKEIEAGTINFDVLVASRQFVPKLAKLAKILGPKGLMPNPKNGTITENPEVKKKELEGGKVTFKAEKKQPVMHITIGKTKMETQALVENLNALLAALENKVIRATISATMSPGIKVKLG
jgi:large subunit ribosomal protein L1